MVVATENLQAWSVTALTSLIKNKLEIEFPSVTVLGEVSNCKQQQTGHWYFTLKDEYAQISVVMFRTDATSLAFIPQNGDKVIVEGALNVYPPGGRYQIVIRKMQKQGLGELLLRLEALKKMIHQRGWFKKEFKKPLPFLPKRIGVVTSPTGAVIQDIIHALTRRGGGGFNLILNPVKVQGEGSAQEIAQAIKFFNERLPVDVIIIGRGGGSLEDLWSFNEEIVAEAIFHSKIPTICAVGHETDHTIAEYVADMRASTPTAAAEMVMAEKLQQQKHLNQLQKQCQQALVYHVRTWMQKMDECRSAVDRSLRQRIQHLKLKLAGYRKALEARDPRLRLKHLRQLLVDWGRSFDRLIYGRMVLQRQRLKGIQQTLQAIDPAHLLKKGFSILFAEKDGSVITNGEKVHSGDKVRIRLAKGNLKATIDRVEL